MIKLAAPEIDNKEIQQIKMVLDSGWLIQGKRVKEFEKKIARFVGTKYAIAVNSGTSALYLSLLALEISKGDKVITSNFTFPATANTIELTGAKTTLVDIKLDTFNINTSEIKSKITSKTKAIIPVHLFGQSTDMTPIIKLAKQYGLKIIEDAACALGATYKKRMCGNFGDLGCFSFHPRKAITTGEGGMIVTNKLGLAKKLRLLRNHGMASNKDKTDFILPGLNNRMTEMQAAMGVVQIKKLNKIIQQRQKIAKIYDKLLCNIGEITIPKKTKDTNHTYQSYIVLLKKNINRNKLIQRLKKQEIETGIPTYALHKTAYFRKKYNFSNNEFPNSKTAFEQGLSLPMHSKLTAQEVEFIIKKIKFFLL